MPPHKMKRREMTVDLYVISGKKSYGGGSFV